MSELDRLRDTTSSMHAVLDEIERARVAGNHEQELKDVHFELLGVAGQLDEIRDQLQCLEEAQGGGR